MLDKNHPNYIDFPDPDFANKHGFLAHGGDLSTHTLLSAYQQGIFPWFNDNEPILWWSPNPRMVIPTAGIRISRSLRKTIRTKKFTITAGKAFEEVMEHCSKPRKPNDIHLTDEETPQTWITQDMKDAYLSLHKAGYAQSVECWENNTLVGGLYGVTIAGMYFGESMFSSASNSSKVALASLCQFLHHKGVDWVDCQVESEHLVSLGAVNIERTEFLKNIQTQLLQPIDLPWEDLNLLIL